MSKIEELQKRVEHLETEVELLKELIELQNKVSERTVHTYPQPPTTPWYRDPYIHNLGPALEPPYKITCQGGKNETI